VQIFGHQAILATSGEQALSLVSAQSPDLIITDMRLPDMDGLTLLERLRQEPSQAVPVIMLSASAELDVAKMAEAAGAKAFVNKPVRLQSLLDVIQQYALS
jgi:CheY-like chemotaxis protein